MVKGKCISYLDEHRIREWPTEFVAVPNIGDRVKALKSEHMLKVHSITHCQRKIEIMGITKIEPYIIIELNK